MPRCVPEMSTVALAAPLVRRLARCGSVLFALIFFNAIVRAQSAGEPPPSPGNAPGASTPSPAIENGPLPQKLKPGTILFLSQSQSYESAGYSWDGKDNHDLQTVFQVARPISDLALTKNSDTYYFVEGNNIMAAQPAQPERTLFSIRDQLPGHNVRYLQVDDVGNVYFGLFGGDQHKMAEVGIYRISPPSGNDPAHAVLFCPISSSDLQNADQVAQASALAEGGTHRTQPYWAGAFCFGKTAKNTLDLDTIYLIAWGGPSSAIYRIKRQDGKWGDAEQLFEFEQIMVDLWVAGPSKAYFLSLDSASMRPADLLNATPILYRLSDWSEADKIFTVPQQGYMFGFSVVP